MGHESVLVVRFRLENGRSPSVLVHLNISRLKTQRKSSVSREDSVLVTMKEERRCEASKRQRTAIKFSELGIHTSPTREREIFVLLHRFMASS